MANVILGGPSYQLLLDARHAGSMAGLALRLMASRRAKWVEFHWGHGCPVEHARNSLFAHALASEATHLLWADSDCYWPSSDVDGWLWTMEQLERRDLPFAAFPVMQRNGDSNIVLASERTEHDIAMGNASRWPRYRGELNAKGELTIPMAAELKPCAAAGLGAAVFFLPWYRAHWPKAPWFRTDWRGGEMISEDFWHTSALRDPRRRGGLQHDAQIPGARYAPVVQVIHAPRGGGAES